MPSGPVDDQLIDELVTRAQAEGLQLTGEGGLLQQLTMRLPESALEGEITDHRGNDTHDPAGKNGVNSLNGKRSKTLLTDAARPGAARRRPARSGPAHPCRSATRPTSNALHGDGLSGSGPRGSRTANTAPAPGSLATVTFPPCASRTDGRWTGPVCRRRSVCCGTSRPARNARRHEAGPRGRCRRQCPGP